MTHIVFFRLQEYSEKAASELQARLASMRGHVPTLHEIEVGVDFERSGRAWDVVLLTRFASRADLDAYQKDPYHLDVVAYVRGVCKETAVVDYDQAS